MCQACYCDINIIVEYINMRSSLYRQRSNQLLLCSCCCAMYIAFNNITHPTMPRTPHDNYHTRPESSRIKSSFHTINGTVAECQEASSQ